MEPFWRKRANAAPLIPFTCSHAGTRCIHLRAHPNFSVAPLALQLERPLLKFLPHAGFDTATLGSASPRTVSDAGSGFSGPAAFQRPAGSESVDRSDSLFTFASPLAQRYVKPVAATQLDGSGTRDRPGEDAGDDAEDAPSARRASAAATATTPATVSFDPRKMGARA